MSTEHLNRETFSSVDTAWLHIDTPTNLANIVGVITFDGQVDFERFKTNIEKRLLIFHRFKQRVRESTHPLGLPQWEDDPNFDLNFHVNRVLLPAPADHEALQNLAGELMSTPLDPAKPLWQFTIIENYGENSALICRLHHCIADGLALVQVLLSIADEEPDAILPEVVENPPRELSPLARLIKPAIETTMRIGQTWRATESFVHEGMDTIIHPSRLVGVAKTGASATLALGKLLFIGPDRRTKFRGKCDVAKRTVWSQPIKLEEIKAIGRLMGGTVNDVLLSAVTGSLRRYLEEHGDSTIGLNIRAVVPVNLRRPDELSLMGNRFGLVFLSLPIGQRDPLKRLVVLRRRMNEIKDTPEAVVAFGILTAIGLTPNQIEDLIIAIFAMKGTAVMTNVPGPRKPLYMVGKKITNMIFWVPMPGNIGLGVSIISYAGEVVLGVASDAGLVPDPERILDGFQAELDEMRQWGRPSRKKF